jgi:hypothetical protein
MRPSTLTDVRLAWCAAHAAMATASIALSFLAELDLGMELLFNQMVVKSYAQ